MSAMKIMLFVKIDTGTRPQEDSSPSWYPPRLALLGLSFWFSSWFLLAKAWRYSAAARRDGAVLVASIPPALLKERGGERWSSKSELEESLANSFERYLSGDSEFGAKEAVAEPWNCGSTPFAVVEVIVPDKGAAIDGVGTRALACIDCGLPLDGSDKASLRTKELV